MNRRTPPRKPAQGAAPTRDDRLKQALKANLARRKQQMRARAAGAEEAGAEERADAAAKKDAAEAPEQPVRGRDEQKEN